MNEIPGLSKGEFGFEGTMKIQAWAEFQSTTVNSTETSEGTCRLSTGGDMVVNEPKIEDFHLNAFNYLIENQKTIKDSILNYLLNQYPNLQEQYGYEDDEKSEYMPEVKSKEQFKQLIEMSNVHLMNVEKEGYAYVGYEFGCKWDDEHGIGFMTHKDRIIDFGGADTSFLTWIAERDLSPIEKPEISNSNTEVLEERTEVLEERTEEVEERTEEPIKKKKPWWKI
jgi:hypothetical protein